MKAMLLTTLLLSFTVFTARALELGEIDLSAWYTIRAKHSGLALTVDTRIPNGGGATQSEFKNGGNQKWKFHPTADGFYLIFSKASPSCIQFKGGIDTPASNGLPLELDTSAGRSNQEWAIRAAEGGGFELHSKKDAQKVWDVASASKMEWATVQVWDINPSGDNQKWILEKRPIDDTDGPSIFPPGPAATAVTTSAAFIFRIENIQIHHTRSRHEDTLFTSAGVRVGGASYPVMTKQMGDSNDGIHEVGIEFGPITIPNDANVPVNFTFEVMNNGHDKDVAEKLKQRIVEMHQKLIIDASRSLTDGAFGLEVPSELTLIAGNPLVDWFLRSVILVNCDGICAADQISMSADQMFEATKSASTIRRTIRYKGYNSPTGCGPNSDYSVTWSISRK